MTLDSGTLEIRIEDEGKGFDWKNVTAEFPDPSHPGNQGMGIMKTFFDEVTFVGKGNIVLLRANNIC